MKKGLRIVYMILSVILIVSVLLIYHLPGKREDEPPPSEFNINLANQYFPYVRTETVYNPVTSAETGKTLLVERDLDVYIDESDKTQYYYFSGTELLCGFLKWHIYFQYTDSPVSENEAKSIVETYFSEVIPEFRDYRLIHFEYSEQEMVYHLQYSYHLNGVPTDDLINGFLRANGEIGGFMMINRGLYKDIKINKEDVAKLSQGINDDNFVSQYIAMSEEGLVLLQDYEVQDGAGETMIDQTATLLQYHRLPFSHMIYDKIK